MLLLQCDRGIILWCSVYYADPRICKIMLNIFFRLIEEGYTPRENDGQRFSQRHVSEAVQTLNLKQVAELAAADYIKVDILHFPANIKKKICILSRGSCSFSLLKSCRKMFTATSKL